jgi:hypothetical protein
LTIGGGQPGATGQGGAPGTGTPPSLDPNAGAGQDQKKPEDGGEKAKDPKRQDQQPSADSSDTKASTLEQTPSPSGEQKPEAKPAAEAPYTSRATSATAGVSSEPATPKRTSRALIVVLAVLALVGIVGAAAFYTHTLTKSAGEAEAEAE